MFSLFNFWQIKKSDGNNTALAPVAGTTQDQQFTATRRELIRIVLRDTLHKHGIPAAWIGCETVMATRNANRPAYLTHLVVKKWNEHLIRFAPALQQQLSLGLSRFDSAIDPSTYIFYWKFPAEHDCPITAMPEPSFWTIKPEISEDEAQIQPSFAPRHEASSPRLITTTRFDLPLSEYDHRRTAFAPTIPGEMI
jgi:hypothetical protein